MIKKVNKKHNMLTESQKYQKVLAGSLNQNDLLQEEISLRVYQSECYPSRENAVATTKEDIKKKLNTFTVYMEGQDFVITVEDEGLKELTKLVDAATAKAEEIAKTDIDKFVKDNDITMSTKQKKRMQERYASRLIGNFSINY